jgi:hypothetical protein
LVLVEALDEPELGHEIDATVSRRWLAEVDQLVAEGYSEAATLIAFAGLEAALRSAAEWRGAALGRAPSREVLRTAASLGDIDEAEYGELSWMWRVRDELAHGFESRNDTHPPLSDIASFVAATGRRVLDDLEAEMRERAQQP